MTESPGPAGMRALQALPQPPDPAAVLEIVRTMRGELAESMGIEITEFTPERVIATMPVVGNRQPFGLLHGGASAALAETHGLVPRVAGRRRQGPAGHRAELHPPPLRHRRPGHRGLHPAARRADHLHLRDRRQR